MFRLNCRRQGACTYVPKLNSDEIVLLRYAYEMYRLYLYVHTVHSYCYLVIVSTNKKQ